MTADEIDDRVRLSARVVAAFLRHNPVPPTQIEEALELVYRALAGLSIAPRPPAKTAEEIDRSIGHDALISFEDGKPYRTLRRHLSARGMTPEGYRDKHGLPPDYPMTAMRYSILRSRIARRGRRPSNAEA